MPHRFPHIYNRIVLPKSVVVCPFTLDSHSIFTYYVVYTVHASVFECIE